MSRVSAIPIRKAVLTAVCGSLLLSSSAFALDPRRSLGQYVRQTWSLEQGLPSILIKALAQTGDGYLWIGTRSGLVRFDGRSFERVRRPDARIPGDEDIERLTVDGAGRLWAATRSGLLRLEGGGLRTVAFGGKLVTAIERNPVGGVWAESEGALFAVDQGRALPVQATPAFGAAVRSLAFDAAGGLWVGLEKGMGRLRDGKFERLAVDSPVGDLAVTALSAVAPDEILIGTNGNGFYRLSQGRVTALRPADADGKPILSVRRDGDGGLWAASDAGLYRHHAGRLRIFDQRDGLIDKRIHDVLEDREKNLWVATGNGLNRFHDGAFTGFGIAEGLPSEFVTAILQTSDGAIWIGTRDRGLVRFTAGAVPEIRTFEPGPAPAELYVRGLLQIADGVLFIGTRGGLFTFHDGKLSREHAGRPLPRSEIFALAPSRDGGFLVSAQEGLLRYRQGRFLPIAVDRGKLIGMGCLLEDRDGALWLPTSQGGIARFAGGRLQIVGDAAGPAPGPALTALQDDDGAIWVGSRGGVSRLQGGKWSAWTARSGIPIEDIAQIAQDDRGHLWLGGIHGILQVRKADLALFLDGRATFVPVREYGEVDGLKTRECALLPGNMKDRDGRLWFATTQGAVVVDPNQLHENRTPPPVMIRGAVLDDVPHAVSGWLRVPPATRNLVFSYTAFTFRDPERTTFRYRLWGFDDRWVDAGSQRSARYTNVPPGEFRFEVTARNEHGVAGVAAAALALTVVPRFRQTRTFAVLSILGFGLLAWGLVRLNALRLRRRFALVVAERNRIARNLHDNLDQHLFAIGLQLDLAAGQVGDPDAAAGKHVELARKLLDTCKTEAQRSVAALRSHVLEEAHGDLKAAFDRIAAVLSAGTGITVFVKVDRLPATVTDAVKNELLHIGQELMANAVRHGRPRSVQVSVAIGNDSLSLRVVDDGAGFDPETTAKREDGHFGLIGVRERAKEMGGSALIESRSGAGCAVAVTIPMHT